MHPSHFAQLQSGATLITANQRLARHLGAEYGVQQRTGGAPVWEAPDIVPWNQWLERTWQDRFGILDSKAPQPLLNSFQELALWETIIRESEKSPLLQEPAAARDARSAWQLLHAFRLPLSRAGEFGNEDANAFVRWAKAYQKRCVRDGLLDAATLPDAIGRAIGAGWFEPPRQVLLAGFDELSPQQTALLDVMRAAGSSIDVFSSGTGGRRVARATLIDARAEQRAAAAWARAALETGARRIGIVVPDLSSVRNALMRELDEVLAPEALFPGLDVVRPYNVSLGESLASVPLVHAALTILGMGQGPLMLGTASQILRSPFIAGHANEQAARARIDIDLRRTREVSLTAHVLMRKVQEALTANRTAAPMLAAQLKAWRDRLPSRSQRKPPSAWSEQFALLLHLVGWPGDGAPNHDRLRTLNAWRDLLAELATLDSITPQQTYDEALGQLRRMAIERIFQPPTPAAPVQVLGLMEAAGLEFDRLWIMGLDDETWPPSPRPNPFLPNALQREHRMPHASAERELEFAHTLMDRLLASAPDVVVSHAAHAGDEIRRPSPLIVSIPDLDASALSTPHRTLAAQQLEASNVERLVDHHAVELAEGSRVPGGTSLLQHQAACPFRAFAQVRLAASAPEEPEAGLDSRARGTLVHEALRFLWEEIRSHENLVALDSDRRNTAIARAIEKAIANAARHHTQTLTGRFREIEARRLTTLMQLWLEVEKQRAPFTLHTAENDTILRLGGLEISGRIDRIDTLADGTVAITDYKTGSRRPKSWYGERPDEPQIPAYAVGRDPPLNVGAVMFAQLKRDKHFGFHGMAAADGVANGVSAAADWPAQLSMWHATLDRLAEDFRRGDARVDPKEFPQSCQYCGLMSLCRVHEQGVMPNDGDGENGDG